MSLPHYYFLSLPLDKSLLLSVPVDLIRDALRQPTCEDHRTIAATFRGFDAQSNYCPIFRCETEDQLRRLDRIQAEKKVGAT